LTSADTPIVLTRVSKSYVKPPVLVVHSVSLAIARGEFFCLIGPSGCGKSTIIKLIAGIEAPTSGVVRRPDRLGMVFQSYALLPWLTVRANVAFAARMSGLDRGHVEATTDLHLRMVHLEAFAARYPRELSGGQRHSVSASPGPSPSSRRCC